MAAKFVVFVALLALVNAGMVRRDAPAANNELKKDLDSVLEQFSAFSSSLQNFIAEASGKTKETLESTKQSIEKTVSDLRKAHPEVEQQAGKLSEQARAAVATGVKEVEKLAKEAQSNAAGTYEKLAPTVKEAADNFVKNVGELQKKLQEPTKE